MISLAQHMLNEAEKTTGVIPNIAGSSPSSGSYAQYSKPVTGGKDTTVAGQTGSKTKIDTNKEDGFYQKAKRKSENKTTNKPGNTTSTGVSAAKETGSAPIGVPTIPPK